MGRSARADPVSRPRRSSPRHSSSVFATLGGILNERAGIINIGLEGTMLMAALDRRVRALGSSVRPGSGLPAGSCAGALIAWIHGFVSISLGANQIVSGTAINLLGLGLSSFLIRIVFGLKEQQRVVPHFDPVSLPLLADLPLLGPVIFHQHALVYVAFLLVPVMWVILYKTPDRIVQA